jgi:hypothetical protein
MDRMDRNLKCIDKSSHIDWIEFDKVAIDTEGW